MRAARNNGALFVGLSAQLLGEGQAVRFRAAGTSMLPTIQHGDLLTVGPVDPAGVQPGDIILFHQGQRPIVHRVAEVLIGADGATQVITRGDGKTADDAPIGPSQIHGKVVAIERGADSLPTRIRRVVSARWFMRPQRRKL